MRNLLNCVSYSHRPLIISDSDQEKEENALWRKRTTTPEDLQTWWCKREVLDTTKLIILTIGNQETVKKILRTSIMMKNKKNLKLTKQTSWIACSQWLKESRSFIKHLKELTPRSRRRMIREALLTKSMSVPKLASKVVAEERTTRLEKSADNLQWTSSRRRLAKTRSETQMGPKR